MVLAVFGIGRQTTFAIIALVALFAAFGVFGPEQPKADAQVNAEVRSGEILVKFKRNILASAAADTHWRIGGSMKEVISGLNVHVVRVPAGQEQALAAAYQLNPSVLFAEPNGIYRAIGHAPNDLRVGNQWQYNNTGQTGGTKDADIDAFETRHVTTLNPPVNPSVPIAVLDTGIDTTHEDLKSKIIKARNFTWSSTVNDRHGHGTHVAGSAAAVTDNGIGVSGTCPSCVLFNVKVLDDRGSGAWSWIANGIRWAADNGAKVISMSLGGSSPSSTVEAAVNYAWNKGVVVVAAAGNSGTNLPSYPAFYTNVIAVGATDHNDAKPSWSNFGYWVDVAAPGVSILSTAPDHNNRIWGSGVKYGTISGTSMATPHVAGVAGLVWSTGSCSDNTWTPVTRADCVRDRIELNADPPGKDTYWTYGRVNANNSVLGVPPPAP